MATSSAADIGAELGREIRRQGRDDITRQAPEETAAIAEYARSIAPVRTGKFRDSIHIEHIADRDRLPAWRLISDDPKAPFLEFGTADTPEFATFAKTANRFGGDQQ